MQKAVANTLWNLTAGSQQNKHDVVAAGALPRLVSLLTSGELSVQNPVAQALWNLAFSPHQNKDTIIPAGALPLLIGLLRSDQLALRPPATGALSCSKHSATGQPALQKPGANAVWKLAAASQQNKEAIIAARICMSQWCMPQPGFGAPTVAGVVIASVWTWLAYALIRDT